MFVFGAIKSSDAYRGALRSVERDPQVIDALGTPIHAGFWVTGSVNVNNGQGNARIEFPVEGPKQRARVHAEATLESGAWHYTEIVVTPKSGPPINVRQP